MQDSTINSLKGAHTLQPERFCKYIHRYCNQTRINGYDYCIRHILEDKHAPYKQCTYVHQPNKKRCANAAPKNEKNDRSDVLCPFHAKRSVIKERKPLPKRKHVKDPAAILRRLEHYCHAPSHVASSSRNARQDEKRDLIDVRPSTLSDVEFTFLSDEPALAKASVSNVDDEFCFAESKDPLENAGVYTHKEIARIARDKILRLQELYCDELKMVNHKLKEIKREFRADMKKLTSGHRLETSRSVQSEIDPNLLKALSEYHRYKGVHKILRRRASEKRLGVSAPPDPQKCTFQSDEVKCHQTALALTMFCRNHIMSDLKQVLFQPCGLGRNCQNPVIPFEADSVCQDHFIIPLKQKTENNQSQSAPSGSNNELFPDSEPFQSMDDIASLGLDAIIPGSLFGLDQFGDPGESTETAPSDDEIDLMHIQPITPNLPADILSHAANSDSD